MLRFVWVDEAVVVGILVIVNVRFVVVLVRPQHLKIHMRPQSAGRRKILLGENTQ